MPTRFEVQVVSRETGAILNRSSPFATFWRAEQIEKITDHDEVATYTRIRAVTPLQAREAAHDA